MVQRVLRQGYRWMCEVAVLASSGVGEAVRGNLLVVIPVCGVMLFSFQGNLRAQSYSIYLIDPSSVNAGNRYWYMCIYSISSVFTNSQSPLRQSTMHIV